MQKDYYKILELPMKASLADIKQSYRKLARQFHPDTNTDAHSTVFFHDIQEAYEILSNPVKRSSYDYELKKTGKYAGYDRIEVTNAEQIAQQSADLLKYVTNMQDQVINHDALADFILGLLNVENLQVIKRKQDFRINEQIAHNILGAAKAITAPRLYLEISERLYVLIPDTEHAIHQQVTKGLLARQKAEEQHKIVPLIALALVALFAIITFIIIR